MDPRTIFSASSFSDLIDPPDPDGQLCATTMTVLCVTDCRARLREIAKISERICRLGKEHQVDLIIADGIEEKRIDPDGVELSAEMARSVDGELSATIAALENICSR